MEFRVVLITEKMFCIRAVILHTLPNKVHETLYRSYTLENIFTTIHTFELYVMHYVFRYVLVHVLQSRRGCKSRVLYGGADPRRLEAAQAPKGPHLVGKAFPALELTQYIIDSLHVCQQWSASSVG